MRHQWLIHPRQENCDSLTAFVKTNCPSSWLSPLSTTKYYNHMYITITLFINGHHDKPSGGELLQTITNYYNHTCDIMYITTTIYKSLS